MREMLALAEALKMERIGMVTKIRGSIAIVNGAHVILQRKLRHVQGKLRKLRKCEGGK